MGTFEEDTGIVLRKQVEPEPQGVDAIVDPKERLEVLCRATEGCAKVLAEYEKCSRRVLSRSGTTEVCVPEFFELRSCIDNCVSFLSISVINTCLVGCQAAV